MFGVFLAGFTGPWPTFCKRLIIAKDLKKITAGFKPEPVNCLVKLVKLVKLV